VGFLALFALVSIVALPACAALTVTPAGAAANVSLSTFVSAFPTHDSFNGTGLIGPVGVVFRSGGGILVSDYPGNVRLFASDTDGQTAAAGVIGQTYAVADAESLCRVGSNIYMAQQPSGALVQLNADGSLNQTIVTGMTTATGVAVNPVNGHVFVSARGSNQIDDVDPIAKTKSVFNNLQATQLLFSPDGSVLYAADPSVTGHIFGYNTTTKAQVFDSGFIAGQPSGMAFGTGTLTGKLVVETTVNGTVLTVDLATLAQTVIATGGSRGGEVIVDPNGTLLLTQSDSLVRLSSVPEPVGMGLWMALAGVLLRRSRSGSRRAASRQPSDARQIATISTAVLVACLCVAAPSARAVLSVTPAGAAKNVNLTTFASGFPTSPSGNNTGLIGPIGIAFPASGGVLVSDYPGNVRLFATNLDGQSAASAPVGQNFGLNNAEGIARAGSNLYMAEQPGSILVQINDNGTFNQTIATGLTGAVGVAINPLNGHVFVSARGADQIYDVDPIAKTKTLFVNLQADQLLFSPDGSVLYAADPTVTGHIYGYNTTTKAQVFDSGFITGDPSGMAFGTGTLTGSLVVETYVGGQVVAVDLATLAQTVLATGGSRGEHMYVDPSDGSLLLTQSDSIVRLSTVPEPASGLMGIGLIGLMATRRRARQSSVNA
jgi:hypothetical protein